MDFFIKKIFEGRVEDELVHLQFQKFSKGEFKDKAMVRIKNSSGKFNIATTAEYTNELVRVLAEKLGENKAQVTGALISALKLEGFDYKEKKSAIGVNKYIIDKEMSGNEIVELCNNVKKAFFGLSFKTNDYDLKIKAKSPKSSKGSSGKKKEGEKAKIDFCKLKTTDKELAKNLAFDRGAENFKQIEIKHDFIIEDIIINDELKQECKGDFLKIRELAKRKGKVIRELDIDGKKVKKEVEFEA